jgi:hypothetical protein
MAAEHHAVLRAFASQIGYACRRARRGLSHTDQLRFLSPVLDALDDIGDALHPHGLAALSVARPAVRGGVALLEQLANRGSAAVPFVVTVLGEASFLEDLPFPPSEVSMGYPASSALATCCPPSAATASCGEEVGLGSVARRYGVDVPVEEQFAKQEKAVLQAPLWKDAPLAVAAAATVWHDFNLRGIVEIMAMGEAPPQISGEAEVLGSVPPFPAWGRECSDIEGSRCTTADEERGVPELRVSAVSLEEAVVNETNEAVGSCEVDGSELADDGCAHEQPEFEWWPSWCPGAAKQTHFFVGTDDGESDKSESEDSYGFTPSDYEVTHEQEQEKEQGAEAAKQAAMAAYTRATRKVNLEAKPSSGSIRSLETVG